MDRDCLVACSRVAEEQCDNEAETGGGADGLGGDEGRDVDTADAGACPATA